MIRLYLYHCQDTLVCDRIRSNVEVAIMIIWNGVFGLPVPCSRVIPVGYVHTADLRALPVFLCFETVLQSPNARNGWKVQIWSWSIYGWHNWDSQRRGWTVERGCWCQKHEWSPHLRSLVPDPTCHQSVAAVGNFSPPTTDRSSFQSNLAGWAEIRV